MSHSNSSNMGPPWGRTPQSGGHHLQQRLLKETKNTKHDATNPPPPAQQCGPSQTSENKRPPLPGPVPDYDQDYGPPARQTAQQQSITSWINTVSTPTQSPNTAGPVPDSFRDSAASSVYPVPDSSVSQAQQAPQPSHPKSQPNRRPPLGPPPSARRGPPSYYPVSNYVTPISEETDSQRRLHDSKSSFASSIPIGISRNLANEHDMSSPRASPFNDQEEYAGLDENGEDRPGLVRQASIGKKSTPILTTIQRSDSRRGLATQREPDVSNMNFPFPEASPDDRSDTSRPQLSTRTNSSGILGRSNKVPNETEKTHAALTGSGNIPPEQPSTCQDPEKVVISTSDEPKTLAQRVGGRRPPPLNVDAVRDAEARGSLTSLQDLILRATKVASNLDRGRTASRLGFNFFEDEPRKSVRRDSRRSVSLSDILASFPPPGLAGTPTSGTRGGRWSSRLQHSTLPSESDVDEVSEKRKRCCGLPLWLFLTLLLVVLVLVAAAVIIPIVLVVLPQHKTTYSSGSASALAMCHRKLTCQNGSINIIGSRDTCSCLCVNGFAGAGCTEISSPSCTTTNIGQVENVTLGDSIPRLLLNSEAKFGISLNASAIVGVFSASKLTCTSENALVTFNSLSSSNSNSKREIVSSTPTKSSTRRAATTSAAGPAVTSNGIVFQSGSARGASSSSPTSSAKPIPSSSSLTDPTTLDFARVAVLVVLQESGQLDQAITAQGNLQEYFRSGTTSTGQHINASAIDLGSGFSANLRSRTVRLIDGSFTT